MTEGSQRAPALAPAHGYRKLTGANGTLLFGLAGGQEALKYLWDTMATILNGWISFPIEPMPEKVAADVFALLAALAFYQMEEK